MMSLGRRAVVVFAVTVAAVAQDVAADPATVSDRAVGFRLPERTVAMPIVVVRGYPFIEGEVNGVRGKLLLDTGARDGLILNDHRISLPRARVIGTNMFGSGQRFTQRLNDSIAEVRLPAGLRFTAVGQVESQDATQLERITPDFIGWIGWDFFKRHAMELDYRRARVTFHPVRPTGTRGRSGRPLFTIHYELRRLPNHPIAPARIGNDAFVAAFDTGQYGTLYIDRAVGARLDQAGVLTQLTGEADDRRGVLGKWSIAAHNLPPVERIEIADPPFAAARGMQLAEPNVVTVGYGLLHQFRTIWDWRRQEIVFYRR